MTPGTVLFVRDLSSTNTDGITRDMADEHPQAEVKGIDLSPIQPPWVPPNLKFEIDDYNLDWLDVEKFDLIHARELLGTVPNWPELYRKALRRASLSSPLPSGTRVSGSCIATLRRF
jgi:hypothetical protein